MRTESNEVTLPREFFRVASIIPAEQEIVHVPPGTKVRSALEIMSSNQFSQLPVVAGGTVIGVFTYRSLARHLGSIRRQDDPLDMTVDELLEDLTFVRPGAGLGEIMPLLDRDDAILVGDEQRLLAIATASDVTAFLWEATRPFIIIRDIELAIRDLMHCACPSTDELAVRIAAALPDPSEEASLTALEKLTLGQLILVLLHGDNFGQCFKSSFGNNRHLVRAYLESACDVRNKVFHFLEEVTVEEIDGLLATWRWLERKALTVRSLL